MMVVRLNFAALKQAKPYEYAVRFTLGGLTTVAAGLVADHLGPVMGGLFLAFPAIFAASATLIEKHERERKAKKGLRGEKRAKGAAALDAAGAAWGSIGLAGFGAVIWLATSTKAVVCIGFASLIWFAIVVGVWRLRRALPAPLRRLAD
jgi:hypothetical protein